MRQLCTFVTGGQHTLDIQQTKKCVKIPQNLYFVELQVAEDIHLALEVKINTLTAATADLCEHLDPKRVIRKLKSEFVIDKHEDEKLQSCTATDDRVEMLLNILKTKDNKSFDIFKEELKKERNDLYSILVDHEAKFVIGR